MELRDKFEIKVFILFLLNNLEEPLEFSTVKILSFRTVLLIILIFPYALRSFWRPDRLPRQAAKNRFMPYPRREEHP